MKANTSKTKAAAPKTTTAQKRPVRRRTDFGAPVESFFARQVPTLKPILERLRAIVEEAAPDARAALKWGQAFYSIGDAMVCGIAGHKAHVNLILSGPPGTFTDPGGLLLGDGKTGRHLKLTSLGELPDRAVRDWVKAAANLARSGG